MSTSGDFSQVHIHLHIKTIVCMYMHQGNLKNSVLNHRLYIHVNGSATLYKYFPPPLAHKKYESAAAINFFLRP